MRNVIRLMMGVLAVAAFSIPAAQGQIFFQDNFEHNDVSAADGLTPIEPPQVGISWTELPTSGAHGIDIVDTPAIGTRSMRVLREATPPLGPSNGTIDGLSLPGAIVGGNLLEVQWSHFLSTEGPIKHRFNAPMQVSIGHAGSNFNNDLAFILVNDTDGGSYHYSDSTAQYGGSTSTGVQPSLDAWDTLRAVLRLEQIDATTMGGTYDLFVSLGGGAEQQLASNATLFHTTIPAVDPTHMQLRIGKGPSTAWSFYDDISVIPEPSMMMLGAVCGVLLLRRRRC